VPKVSNTNTPSTTVTAGVQKPSADAPSVEHSDIKPTGVTPGVPVPTVTNVNNPKDGHEHWNGPSVDNPSVPDITKVDGGNHGDDGNELPDVTKTKDQEHKVPEVSPSTPSYTTTLVPEFQSLPHPSGTPEVNDVKGETGGDVPTPETDDIEGKGRGKGKGRKGVKGNGSNGHEVEDDGDWETENTHGPWEAETEGSRNGIKTEVEHGDDD